jgi:hypothetical protein
MFRRHDLLNDGDESDLPATKALYQHIEGIGVDSRQAIRPTSRVPSLAPAVLSGLVGTEGLEPSLEAV